jgi:hypothetical protein
MDFLREILPKCEEHEHGFAPPEFDIDGFTAEQIGFHVYLLGEAGLLQTREITGDGDNSPQAAAISITNGGYDFLQKTRDPDIWQRSKDVASRAGGWTVQILVGIASRLMEQRVTALLQGQV